MSLDDFITEKGEYDGPFEIIQCKKALYPSNLPEMDYALNPYKGCSHGCIYCYAPEVTRQPWKGWRIPKVKTNIAERLYSELKGLHGIIGIGTVTDPYQYAERRFMVTRHCLEVISRTEMGIHMHTKSDLILRDTDLISKIDHKIGITITGIQDNHSKITEPGAPLPSVRLHTLKTLVSEGINCYALIGPVLSTVEGCEQDLIDSVIATGVKAAQIDRLNIRPELGSRIERMGIAGSENSVRKIIDGLSDAGLKVSLVFEDSRFPR